MDADGRVLASLSSSTLTSNSRTWMRSCFRGLIHLSRPTKVSLTRTRGDDRPVSADASVVKY